MNIGLTIMKDDFLLVRLRIKRGIITHIVLIWDMKEIKEYNIGNNKNNKSK